jgi:type I restriction enzyme S subunit
MNPVQLLPHFDRISDAPDAVPRLRHFILDLAVRGKLVEQIQKDEPASELLKRIQSEKVRLVKEGKIRAPRELEASDEQDVPFPLPTGWAWCKLSEIGAIIGGGTPSSGDPDNFTDGGLGVAWLTPADLGKRAELYVSHGARDLTQQGLRSSSATLMPKGSVLFTSRAPIGYTAIAANEVSTNQGFKSVVPYILDCNLYVAVYFRAFAKWIDGKASGTTFREVSGKIVGNLPFPLPPLVEQHRIVAKVDELMALCARLETAQVKRESRRDRLVAASLHSLNNGAEADAFREHARFYFNHLPRLTTRIEHIQQLRQTTLNLAVRGKLVPQDPSDKPASELLERVAVQKTKAGNAKTGRDWVGDIAKHVDEAFVIPKGWAWTRIANTVERVTVGYVGPMKDQYVQDGIPFLRSQNVRANRFREDGLISISPKFHQTISKSALAPGDVVVVRSGNVGTACVIPPSLLKANCSDLVVVKHPIAVHPTYLCFYLNSLAAAHIEAGTVGVALTHFNTKSVATMPLPLPPLAEQHRIVAKVDELMALCDRLEAQLTTTQTESRRLLEAVLHEALTPALEKIA